MSWQCRLIEIDPDMPCDFQTMEIGTMWYGPIEYAGHDSIMGEDYKRNRAGQRPLWIRLPGNVVHCIDGASYNNGQWGAGWTVTGDPPNITVSPSINHIGIYHGWIRGGVVTDDCEGRAYP
ncbi:MAG: hypothetical protein JWO59_676 [Chloroflexi bacterium]|nr:hypothetical protein [Chloroflexota bacterium]